MACGRRPTPFRRDFGTVAAFVEVRWLPKMRAERLVFLQVIFAMLTFMGLEAPGYLTTSYWRFMHQTLNSING